MRAFADYKPKVKVSYDAEGLAHQTISYFVRHVKKVLAAKNSFSLAISGGYTPKRFFELLGELPESRSLPWDRIHLFWVDERIVSIDSKWSNYKLAYDTFLSKVDIPQKNVHRIPTEYSDFNLAAQRYEESIREVFGLKESQVPMFDLIFLGMGTDGHIASIFPNSYASFDTKDLACVVYVMDEKLNRITLTYPVLCAAANLAILVSGEEKASILKEVLTAEPDEVRYPVHVLWPVLNKVTWLVDKDASKLL